MSTSASKESLNFDRQATAADDTLQNLMTTVRSGWPENKQKLLPGLKPYWTFREEMAVDDGILYKGQIMVIPKFC